MYDIKYRQFNATDLWEVELRRPFPAQSMSLQLIPKGAQIPGFGIYSVAYRSTEFGDRIIYLGKYSGVKNKQTGDNALAGDVRERWFKHIGSATLLLRNLKMSSQYHYYDQKHRAFDFYNNDVAFFSACKNSFLELDESILRKNVFISGADLQVSRNRLGFAIQNLKETHRPELNSKENFEEILSRFTLCYWQVISSSPVMKSSINAKLTGTKKTEGVESEIIKMYCDSLPINNEYNHISKNDPNRPYFHYDPSELIEVGSSNFAEYSRFIESQIRRLIFPRTAIG